MCSHQEKINHGAGTSNQQIGSKRYHCRRCHEQLENGHHLYFHNLSQHGRGETLQSTPYEDTIAPWQNNDGEIIDRDLQHVYQGNAEHILRPHLNNRLHCDYNFRTDNLNGSIEELMNHIRFIYQQESVALKINISFGFILRNIEDGEYRYYIPYRNNEILDRAYLISNNNSIRNLQALAHEGWILILTSSSNDQTVS